MQEEPTYFARFIDIELIDGDFQTVRPLGIIPREEFLVRIKNLHTYIIEAQDKSITTEQLFNDSKYFNFLIKVLLKLHDLDKEKLSQTTILSLLLPSQEYPKSILFDLNYPDEESFMCKEDIAKRKRQQELDKWDDRRKAAFTISIAASILGVTESLEETISTLHNFPAFELSKVLEERSNQQKIAEQDAQNKAKNKPSRAIINKAKAKAKEMMFKQDSQQATAKESNEIISPVEVELDLGDFI